MYYNSSRGLVTAARVRVKAGLAAYLSALKQQNLLGQFY